MSLTLGTRLGPPDDPQRYTIVRCLGEGGQGEVYQAQDRVLRSDVALKRLRHPSTEALSRFKDEFRRFAVEIQEPHPHIVSVRELFTSGDEWYLTMDFVDGVTFLEHVRTGTAGVRRTGPDAFSTRPIPDTNLGTSPHADTFQEPEVPKLVRVDRLRKSLGELALAVHTLHKRGLVHRDLKPANVLVNREGSIVVLDFGLVANISALDATLLREVVIGTPSYMSPEQAAAQPTTEASDWYSVGVMLFEALTGRLPFEGTWLEVLAAKQQHDPTMHGRYADLPTDLVQLCEDLLRRNPTLRPSGDEVLKRLRGRPAESPSQDRYASDAAVHAGGPTLHDTWSWVGRQDELGALQRAFDDLAHGTAVVVYVDGESGIGKSALVGRFLDCLEARADKPLVLRGRCFPRESVPYKALDTLVDQLTSHLQSVRPRPMPGFVTSEMAGDLAHLFPMLGQVLRQECAPEPYATQAVVPATDRGELQQRGFDAFRGLIEKLAVSRGVVLVIDDAHWGDEDSAKLLARLVRPPSPPQVLLILVHRTDEEGPVVRIMKSATSRLGRSAGAAVASDEHGAALQSLRLHIEGLPAEDQKALIEPLISPATSAVTVWSQTIAGEAAGSPFFLLELVGHLLEGGTPVGLTELIRSRVSRLPEGGRQLLEAIAVAGQPLGLEVAIDAAGVTVDAHALLATLMARRLVRWASPMGPGQVETYHDRIRTAVGAGLSSDGTRLEGVHERLARAWEKLGGASPETLAVHWEAAGHGDKAVAHYRLAADEAELAFERAARLHGKVLELLPPGDASAEARVKLAHALAGAGKGMEAAREYQRAAVDLAAADRGSSSGRELQRLAAEQYLKCGHFSDGVPIVRALCHSIGLAFPEQPQFTYMLAALARLQVYSRRLTSRVQRSGYAALLAGSGARLSDEERFQLTVCWSAGFGLGLADAARGSYFSSRFLLLSLKSREPRLLALALAGELVNSAAEGGRGLQRAAVLRPHTQALADTVRDRHPGVVAFALTMGALVDWFGGRWQACYLTGQQAVLRYREARRGFGWELSTAHIFSLSGLCMMGQWRDLDNQIRQLLPEMESRNDTYGTVGLRLMTYRYVVDLAEDHPEAARQRLDAALAEWTTDGFHVQHCDHLFGHVDIDLYEGNGQAAYARIAAEWPPTRWFWRPFVQAGRLRSAHLVSYRITRVFALALRARAALAAAGPPDVEAHARQRLLRVARRDARQLARQGLPCCEGWAELLLAGLAAHEGQRLDALRHLQSAEKYLALVQMPQFVAAARYWREALGDDTLPNSKPDTWMTEQQIKIPERLAAMLAPGGWRRLAGAPRTP